MQITRIQYFIRFNDARGTYNVFNKIKCLTMEKRARAGSKGCKKKT